MLHSFCSLCVNLVWQQVWKHWARLCSKQQFCHMVTKTFGLNTLILFDSISRIVYTEKLCFNWILTTIKCRQRLAQSLRPWTFFITSLRAQTWVESVTPNLQQSLVHHNKSHLWASSLHIFFALVTGVLSEPMPIRLLSNPLKPPYQHPFHYKRQYWSRLREQWARERNVHVCMLLVTWRDACVLFNHKKNSLFPKDTILHTLEINLQCIKEDVWNLHVKQLWNRTTFDWLSWWLLFLSDCRMCRRLPVRSLRRPWCEVEITWY